MLFNHFNSPHQTSTSLPHALFNLLPSSPSYLCRYKQHQIYILKTPSSICYTLLYFVLCFVFTFWKMARMQMDFAIPTCYCGEEAVMKTSWSDDNPSRRFVGCKHYGTSSECSFFDWVDPQFPPQANRVIMEF